MGCGSSAGKQGNCPSAPPPAAAPSNSAPSAAPPPAAAPSNSAPSAAPPPAAAPSNSAPSAPVVHQKPAEPVVQHKPPAPSNQPALPAHRDVEVEGLEKPKPPRPVWAPVQASQGHWTDLMEDAETGNEGGVRARLQRGEAVDVGDENRWTALMEAAERGHVRVVKALLEGKANPNVYDKENWTALMAASEKGSVESAKLLVDAGAIVDMQDKNGWTALMEAAEKGNAPMVRFMVDAGAPHADLNVADKKGWTAFMAACEGGNLECVKYLWKHGSEHKQRDVNRWTALDEAREKGFSNIVAFMEPIVEAEKKLQKMIDSDEWSADDALRNLEDARQVWCLKELVVKAEDSLSRRLVRDVSAEDKGDEDREQAFDLLVQLGHANMVKEDNALHASSIQICEKRLKTALERQISQELKWAMVTTVRAELYPSTELEAVMEEAGKEYQKVAGLPEEWDVPKMVSGLWEGRLMAKIPVEDAGFKERLQSMLEHCTVKKLTRDRHGGRVPDALKLVEVIQVQNDQIFAEYRLRQDAIRADLASSPAEPIAQSVLSNLHVEGRPDLDESINEVWLFHGTKQAAAESIAETDFRLDLAGSNVGTMFGSGIYLAEAATKGDEYTEANDSGLRCLLMCRATLGRYLYIDAKRTDPDTYTRRCLSGEFHSVLGDRQKAVGTFREFVVFDDDQVVPEYLIMYRRVYYVD